MFPGNSLSSKAINNKCKNERKKKKKTSKKPPPDAEELIQQYSNSDCVLALDCKNLQQLCQNPTLWKHVNSAGFAIGITKSEFYPHCVAASKFPFVQ